MNLCRLCMPFRSVVCPLYWQDLSSIWGTVQAAFFYLFVYSPILLKMVPILCYFKPFPKVKNGKKKQVWSVRPILLTSFAAWPPLSLQMAMYCWEKFKWSLCLMKLQMDMCCWSETWMRTLLMQKRWTAAAVHLFQFITRVSEQAVDIAIYKP